MTGRALGPPLGCDIPVRACGAPVCTVPLRCSGRSRFGLCLSLWPYAALELLPFILPGCGFVELVTDFRKDVPQEQPCSNIVLGQACIVF